MYEKVGYEASFVSYLVFKAVNKYANKNAKATYQTLFAALTSGVGGIVGSTVGGIVIDHWGVYNLYVLMFLLSFGAMIGFTAWRKQLEPVKQLQS